MLTVYKASAGSGKTYQLVVEYLKLLLQNPHNYRHILAVTFTNKATGEMKSRILEYLNALSKGMKSTYLETLKAELNLSDEVIRQKAQQVFKNILHDYNHFSISTIDSFTQRVIKSFNRELGISPNFALELDSSMILEEAADRLLAKTGQDSKLLEWLVRFSEEKIIDSKSQRIEKNIISLGQELFKEKFQLFFPETKDSPYTRDNIEEFKNELEKVIALFETSLQHKGKQAMQIIANNGFTVGDFSHKATGIAGFLLSLSERKIKTPGVRVLSALDSAETWFTKTHKRKTELQALVTNHLQPLLGEIIHYYNSEVVKYFSAKAVGEQLRILGILTDLKEEIKTLLHEKGTLQLSDSNLLLSKIIDESDSPFIYEKVGVFFKYFMIDEFQDTSSLQWKNFKPLIANSLAEGNKNLLLGDVKQSIYRWRNSDWNILAEHINGDFPNSPPEIIPLTQNWRSDKNIIEFNNTIIEHLKSAFETNLFPDSGEEWEKQKTKFRNVFSDFKQDDGKQASEKNGWVKATFLDGDDFQKHSVQLLINQVKQLQDTGLRASDIAILIRKNSEGSKIIETFLSAARQEDNATYNLSVLSNESLFLYASRAVLFVIAVMEWLVEPDNKITKAALLRLWQACIKPELASRGLTFPHSENGFHNLDKNFEAQLNSELGHELNLIRRKILIASLDETICEICSHFRLFKMENDLPFLQTLIDKAGEIKTSVSGDISNFLLWWNEKGHKTSVSVNDDVDSIRLLTVHKSKGLEFKAVLIPFLNWEIIPKGNKSPILWCSSDVAPFNRFPLLPVKARTELANTLFSKEYIEETANMYIDTLNLLYVAFTRAQSALFINAVNPSKTDKVAKNVSSLLKASLQAAGTAAPFEQCWNSEENLFSFGHLNHVKAAEPKASPVFIRDYSFNNFHGRLKLRRQSGDLLPDSEPNTAIRNRGTVIHEILSGINTVSDLEKACAQALYNGKIDENEVSEIKRELTGKLLSEAVSPWFNGSMKVINERSLLTPDAVMRPDRIMISENEAIVVDYKTGTQKSDAYKRQVTHYAQTLIATGFKKVDAFLWYIALNEVEKVATFSAQP